MAGRAIQYPDPSARPRSGTGRGGSASSGEPAPPRLRGGDRRAQDWIVGRHYPDLHGDPVLRHGYYYAPRYHKLARLRPGDRLPRHMGPWEFIAADEEGTTSEILQLLLERHPRLDPYRLTYATSTPTDPMHLARARILRRWSYVAVFFAALLVASLALGIPSGRKAE